MNELSLEQKRRECGRRKNSFSMAIRLRAEWPKKNISIVSGEQGCQQRPDRPYVSPILLHNLVQ